MSFCLWLCPKTRYRNIFLNSLSKCSVACDAFWMQFLRCDSWSWSQMCRLRSFTSENLLGTNTAVLRQRRSSLWCAVLISCSCCDRRGEYTLKKLFQVRLCGSNSLSLCLSFSVCLLCCQKSTIKFWSRRPSPYVGLWERTTRLFCPTMWVNP